MPSKTLSPRPARPKATVPVQTWKLQDAKARFSEVCRLAAEKGPQRITRQGKESMVVIAEKEYDKLAGRVKPKTLWEVFAPLVGSGIILEHDTTLPRDIDL